MNGPSFRLPATFTFCFVLLLAAPAHAQPSPFGGDLKETLNSDSLQIENYVLDQDDLKSFYAARDFNPAWNFSGAENQAAFNGFFDSIDKTVQYHGLEPATYPFDLMRKLSTADDNESRLKLELLVADTLLRLAHDLHGDDIDLSPVYPGWNFHRADIDIPGELAKAVADNGVNTFFDRLTPQNPAYKQLAHALSVYRAIAAKGGWAPIAAGPSLRPGDKGKRVAQLRERLIAESYEAVAPTGEDQKFDGDLQKALQAYQTRNGLEPDGHAGTDTQAALNVPVTTRIDQIRANMERWRHMPEDFPPARAIIINIPDFSITILDNGQSIYRGSVIVGQVDRKTPFIQSDIHSMIVNPSWHVPSKIAVADILPKLREDPHYLEKHGFVMRDRDYDPHGETIDWKNMPDEEFNYKLRQQPGAMNSLGRLKFDFDNEFAVYMHGTPHQELFKKEIRALSSGCVRLREPELVAQTLLTGEPDNWDVAHIEEAIAARKTRWVGIKNPWPIRIVYWTVFANEAGEIEFRNDIYDYDRFLMENLKPQPDTPEPATKTEVIP